MIHNTGIAIPSRGLSGGRWWTSQAGSFVLAGTQRCLSRGTDPTAYASLRTPPAFRTAMNDSACHLVRTTPAIRITNDGLLLRAHLRTCCGQVAWQCTEHTFIMLAGSWSGCILHETRSSHLVSSVESSLRRRVWAFHLGMPPHIPRTTSIVLMLHTASYSIHCLSRIPRRTSSADLVAATDIPPPPHGSLL